MSFKEFVTLMVIMIALTTAAVFSVGLRESTPEGSGEVETSNFTLPSGTDSNPEVSRVVFADGLECRAMTGSNGKMGMSCNWEKFNKERGQ